VIDYRWLRHACLASAASMLLTAGCTTTPRLYVDTADEPLECTTFAWLENADRPASIAEQRIRAEVMRTLAARGYLEVTSDPDCLVSGTIYTGARPGSPVSVGVGAGRWGGSFGGSVGVSMPVGGGSRTYGNLAIDVIDVALNAEVWRGTLEGAFRSPEPGSDEVGGAVSRVLAEFPDRPAG
jgi:hypothetical protein